MAAAKRCPLVVLWWTEKIIEQFWVAKGVTKFLLENAWKLQQNVTSVFILIDRESSCQIKKQSLILIVSKHFLESF